MKIKEWFNKESRWCKGMMYADKNGKALSWYVNACECAYSTCLLGAVHLCYGLPSEWQPIIDKISKEINAKFVYYDDHNSIQSWNDDPERTFADVKQLVEELDV